MNNLRCPNCGKIDHVKKWNDDGYGGFNCSGCKKSIYPEDFAKQPLNYPQNMRISGNGKCPTCHKITITADIAENVYFCEECQGYYHCGINFKAKFKHTWDIAANILAFFWNHAINFEYERTKEEFCFKNYLGGTDRETMNKHDVKFQIIETSKEYAEFKNHYYFWVTMDTVLEDIPFEDVSAVNIVYGDYMLLMSKETQPQNTVNVIYDSYLFNTMYRGII